MKTILSVGSKTDFLERLVEEEEKIRQRAEELGVRVGPEPPPETKAPFKPKEGIPRTELTDRELSSLFGETRDILDIYTLDYIAEHLDEAQELFESLSDKPFSPESLVGSRIAQNIHELKTRIDSVRERESPVKPLQEFSSDTKGLLDSLDKLEPSEAKRKYFELLKKEQLLSKNVDRALESETGDRLTEIGKKLQREDKKSSEEIAEELLVEISALIGAGRYDPEGYNRVARKFQQVSEDLPEDLRLKIRDRVRECYAKMKDTEKRSRTEEREREVRTKKFYWDSFAAEVEQLKTGLEKARPGEFFRIYDTYNQLLDSLENADLSNVPTTQIERVKTLLDQSYFMLEDLRARA